MAKTSVDETSGNVHHDAQPSQARFTGQLPDNILWQANAFFSCTENKLSRLKYDAVLFYVNQPRQYAHRIIRVNNFGARLMPGKAIGEAHIIGVGLHE